MKITYRMMTVEQGLHEDLDDILAAAGNPAFIKQVGEWRLYRFPDFSVRGLKVIESATAIIGHKWSSIYPVLAWAEQSLSADEDDEDICWSCRAEPSMDSEGLCGYCA